MKVIKQRLVISTNTFLTIFVLLTPMAGIRLCAQSVEYPVIGQSVPEFELTVDYYEAKTFKPSNAKGKWLILDFWNSGCVGCIQSFPKINQLQNEFKDNVQFLLIGQNDKKYNRNIKKNFDRYTKNLGLKLPIAYDTTLFQRFQIKTVPYVIVINPSGKIYAITSTSEFNRERIQLLIDDKNPGFTTKHDAVGVKSLAKWEYDMTEQKDFLFKSALSNYNGEIHEPTLQIDQYSAQDFFKTTGTIVTELYKFAWIGQPSWVPWDSLYYTHYNYPILETVDSSHSAPDYWTNPNARFNYFVSVPHERATRTGLMKIMQADLQNYFGYTGYFETRLMPCWNLIITDDARQRLVSKSDKFLADFNSSGIKGRRIKIETVVSQIRHYSTDNAPIFDETGMTEKIDIEFNAVMIDILDVKKALEKHGLILQKSTRPMKVLVIRDVVTSTELKTSIK